MSPHEYRELALSLPGAVESNHMDHPDFRVNGKIFATIWKENGVLLLTPVQQQALVESNPGVFSPVTGGWGLKGSTTMILTKADKESARVALVLAWGNKAPKSQKRAPGGKKRPKSH